MSKIKKIDFSKDRFLSVAEGLVDEHEYIRALKMLKKHEEMNGSDKDTAMLYAEIFDDMCLYEKCIHNWFKYLYLNGGDTLNEDRSYAYEGLASAYMNLGNDEMSSYYYKELLYQSKVFTEEMEESVMRTLSREKEPLKFVYPPKIADYTEVINEGITLMKKGECEKAIEVLSGIEEENEDYIPARNYIAMCYLLSDKGELAEEECRLILELEPENVNALTTLSASLNELGRKEESLECAKKLINLKMTSPEDIYKAATVCCENHMHAEAYELFGKLDDFEINYESSIIFFKAVSAYNCGKTEESFNEFEKYLLIYPDSVAAKYYYDLAKKMHESGEKKELEYFYRLPDMEKTKMLAVLSFFATEKDSEAFIKEHKEEIEKAVNWALDLNEITNSEIQILGAACAIKLNAEEYVQDILLNPSIDWSVKSHMLAFLAERNVTATYGVVDHDVLSRADLYELKIGRTKKKYFLTAYARIAARFATIKSSNGLMIAQSAERVYEKLKTSGNLELAKDVDALSVVVFSCAELAEPKIDETELAKAFKIDKKRLDKIFNAL